MIVAFIIWSTLAVVFGGIGLSARKSRKPVGFWANGKAPEVADVAGYNRAVSRLWFVFSLLFEVLGVPLLFCEQNAPLALIPILGTVALVPGLMIAYLQIETKYKK